MTPAFRIVLLGFSEFERRTLASCFRLASSRTPSYRHVQQLADADFVVADADHGPSVQLVAATERMTQTVFIGWRAPPGSTAWMNRPIDPLHVMRELDAMVEAGLRETAAAVAAQVQPQEHAMGPVHVVQALGVAPTPSAEPPAEAAPVASAVHEAPVAPAAPTAPAQAEPLALQAAFQVPVPAPLPLPLPLPLPAPSGPAAAAGPPVPAAETPAAEAPVGLTPHPLPQAPTAAQPVARAAVAPAASPAGQAWPVHIPGGTAAAPPAAAAPPVSPWCGVKPRALLVDDSEIALRFLEAKLQPWGFQIDRAGSSERALELLAAHDYDFVFLDVELGESSAMDGLALCQYIKRHQGTQSALSSAIFMVSAHHSQLDRARGTLAGCDAYLGKPLQDAELTRLLKRHGLVPPAPEPSLVLGGEA